MRALFVATLPVVAILTLSGCETPTNTSPAAAATAPAASTGSARCADRREVTGSRIGRCDASGVSVISGDAVREQGTAGSGPVPGGGEGRR